MRRAKNSVEPPDPYSETVMSGRSISLSLLQARTICPGVRAAFCSRLVGLRMWKVCAAGYAGLAP